MFKVDNKDTVIDDYGDLSGLFYVNPSSANRTKWSNTLKQFVGNLLTNCLSVFGDFVGLALKGLTLSLVRRRIYDPVVWLCRILQRKLTAKIR